MIQGFPGVDPVPLCYEDNHVKGFGSFIRCVYFADPTGVKDFFGVDFSMGLRSTSGVANSFLTVYATVVAAVRYGVPRDTEVVLLNWKMCEPKLFFEIREEAKLISARDWGKERAKDVWSKKFFLLRMRAEDLSK